MRQVLNPLHGGYLDILQAYVIFNEALVTQFIGHAAVMETRMVEQAHIFANQRWKKLDQDDSELKLREDVMDKFTKLANSYDYNQQRQGTKMMPVVHGTNFKVARSICCTGFANLSSVDDGYYGKGIYFTSSAMYAYTYYSNSPEPVLIVCWILTGNVYPVIEAHNNPDPAKNLLAKPLVSGYNSHYIVTNPDGSVRNDIKANTLASDEFVVPQENQICPVYLVKLKPGPELRTAHQKWSRGEQAPDRSTRNIKKKDRKSDHHKSGPTISIDGPDVVIEK